MFHRVLISSVLKPTGCYFDPGEQDGGEASETSSVMGTSSGDAGCSECDQSVKGSAPSSPPTVINILATILVSEVLHAGRSLLAAPCAHGVTKYVVVEILLTRSVTVKASYGYNYIQSQSVTVSHSHVICSIGRSIQMGTAKCCGRRNLTVSTADLGVGWGIGHPWPLGK